jgi:hypothetical protein
MTKKIILGREHNNSALFEKKNSELLLTQHSLLYEKLLNGFFVFLLYAKTLNSI